VAGEFFLGIFFVRVTLSRCFKMEGGQLFVWKLINILMFLFFLLATIVQFNDDDAVVWIPVYVIPAALSLAIAIKPNITSDAMWLTVSHVHTACCICIFAYIVVLLIQHIHKESHLVEKKQLTKEMEWNLLYYEEGRELVGLVLVLGWLKISKTVMTPGNPLQKSRMLLGLLAVPMIPVILWTLCFVDSFNHWFTHCRGMNKCQE